MGIESIADILENEYEVLFVSEQSDGKLFVMNVNFEALRNDWNYDNELCPSNDAPIHFLAINGKPVKQNGMTFKDMMLLLEIADPERRKQAKDLAKEIDDIKLEWCSKDNSSGEEIPFTVGDEESEIDTDCVEPISCYALVYFENSDNACGANIQHFRTKKEAYKEMQRQFKAYKDLECLPDDPSEFTESCFVECDDESITVQDGMDQFRWNILHVTIN